MPPFQYDTYRSPYTGTIAELMQQGTKARADAELRHGQIWAQGVQNVATSVNHAVDVATDPRRKLEVAALEDHRLKTAALQHQMEGRAELSRAMQHSVAPATGPGSSSTLGAGDSGPQLPNFLRKEGDVSVWDTDGIAKLLVAHGYADLAPEFIKDLNALNGAHRTEMKARTDAVHAADDVMAQSAGIALWLKKRFNLSSDQAVDAAIIPIRANGTVPESALAPYLSRLKAQPDGGIAILEEMAARGHQKRIEIGRGGISVNANNPDDVIRNEAMPEIGSDAYMRLLEAGWVAPPPDRTRPPAAAAPPPAGQPPPPAGRPASVQPPVAPQGIIYPDPGTATLPPDPQIAASGTPLNALPGQRVANSGVIADQAPLAPPAPTPPPAATPPAASAPRTDAERTAALLKARDNARAVTEAQLDDRFQKLEKKRATEGLTPDEKAEYDAYTKRKALVPTTVSILNEPKKQEARVDRSYTDAARNITDLRKPIADQAERIARLTESINQRTPQADALIAPELLTAMAGGQGSGLRMNEAEISRIVGGRTKWEDLKAALNKFALDPKQGLSVTDEQRTEMRDLVKAIATRVTSKLNSINKAAQDLIDANDVETHRRIIADVRQEIDRVNLEGAAPANARPVDPFEHR